VPGALAHWSPSPPPGGGRGSRRRGAGSREDPSSAGARAPARGAAALSVWGDREAAHFLPGRERWRVVRSGGGEVRRVERAARCPHVFYFPHDFLGFLFWKYYLRRIYNIISLQIISSYYIKASTATSCLYVYQSLYTYKK